MADMMDCTCDNIVGNSFIANVNMLASQFGTLQEILAVPNEVQTSIDQIRAIETTIDNIHKEILRLNGEAQASANKSETHAVNAGLIKNDTAIIHTKTLDVLQKCREYLEKIRTEVLTFEGDKIVAEGISNGESVFTAPSDLCPGSLLTIKGFRYPVGRNTLLVSCDGIEFYRWIHFEEVGPKGSISSVVKLNVPISKGSVLKFYNISSSMAESAYLKARELKCELDAMHKQVNKDVETVVNAKDCVKEGLLQLQLIKNQVKDYVDRYIGCCNGLVVINDCADIPQQDCVFICNTLLPRVPTLDSCHPKPCITNKRPLFSEGSICGTIVQERDGRKDYHSGCFDVTYNPSHC